MLAFPLTALIVLAAQAPPEAGSAPAEPEVAAPRESEAVVAEETPAPPAEPEAALPAEGDAVVVDEDTTSDAPNPFVTGLAQTATGCGIACGTTGLVLAGSAIPWLGYCLCPIGSACNLCVTPACIGVGVTSVGDLLGPSRGALLWPVLTSYGVQVATVLLGVGASIGVFVGGAVLTGAALPNLTSVPRDLSVLGAAVGLLVVPFLVGTTILVAGALAQGGVTTLVYGLTAEERHPGDDGFRLPGLLEPNHTPPEEETGGDDAVEEDDDGEDETEGDSGAVEPEPATDAPPALQDAPGAPAPAPPPATNEGGEADVPAPPPPRVAY